MATQLIQFNITQLIKITLGGVQASHLEQNAAHYFLYIPHLWEILYT